MLSKFKKSKLIKKKTSYHINYNTYTSKFQLNKRIKMLNLNKNDECKRNEG